jgi:hypothetical protein
LIADNRHRLTSAARTATLALEEPRRAIFTLNPPSAEMRSVEMDVHLQVPDSEADKVHSGIYSFISRFAEDLGEKPFFSITIIPVGVEVLYDLKFANSDTAAAFVDYLPTLFQGVMSTSIQAAF